VNKVSDFVHLHVITTLSLHSVLGNQSQRHSSTEFIILAEMITQNKSEAPQLIYTATE